MGALRTWLYLAVLLAGWPGIVLAEPVERETLYQVSTIDALLAGVYDGQVTLAQLVRRGDLGLGTFDALDGEMVVLDGQVYQVRGDGTVHRPPPETLTPFAAVTFLDADWRAALPAGQTLAQLQQRLDQRLSPNHFYALRVQGRFRAVKVRSVPRQAPPYRPLGEVAKEQAVFDLQEVSGTLVGFRAPRFAKGITVPGDHLHFLADDRQQGGHVLDFELIEGELVVDETPRLLVELPQGEGFRAADLNQDRSTELRAVEEKPAGN